jgi:hypothetical protein
MKFFSWLYLTFLLFFSFQSFGNECVEVFSKFKNLESKQAIELKLVNTAPSITLLKIDKELPQRIFLKTKNDFIESLNTGFSFGSFEFVVDKISKGKWLKLLQDSEDTYQEVLTVMKAKRKTATILRNVFIVFTDKHESPKYFEEFAKSFGKFNDTLEFKAFNTLPDNAKKLTEAFKKNKIFNELENVKNSDDRSIIKSLKTTKENVLKLLKKDELSIKEFHETRKLMKLYMTTIQMMIQVDEKKEFTQAFNFLNELNERLGNLRDENLKKEIEAINSGKKVKLSKTEIIPEDFKINIRLFLDGLTFE